MLGNLFGTAESVGQVNLPLMFRIVDEKALHLDDSYDAFVAWKYFTHHIRRYPHDLRAHVQRVLLATTNGMHDRLAGTLQDLYLALGVAGYLLKENMFVIAKKYLNEEEQQHFKAWLAQSDNDQASHQWYRGTVLSSGYGAKPHKLVIQQRESTSAEYASVLDEVYACLEYGQVDMAQQLLEAECLKPEHDAKVEHELLNIYQYTRNKEHLQAITQRLRDLGQPIADHWLTKLEEAEQWQ